MVEIRQRSCDHNFIRTDADLHDGVLEGDDGDFIIGFGCNGYSFDTFLGFVNINEVIQAAKRKDPTVESIIHMNVPSVSKDVTVEEMLPLISETRSPIAVVNDQNRLLGIVTQTSLIIEATKFNEEEINELKEKANNQ